jgi:predicted RNase H-like HicB family nuclease
MVNLSQEDIREINRLRSLFPAEIKVQVRRSADGGFVAEILTFPGIITEADTFTELIEMINDAVMSYFEVPEKYASFVANYIPSIAMAQQFGIFPVIEEQTNLTLQLTSLA